MTFRFDVTIRFFLVETVLLSAFAGCVPVKSQRTDVNSSNDGGMSGVNVGEALVTVPVARPSENATGEATPEDETTPTHEPTPADDEGEGTPFPDITKIPKNAEEVAMCPEIPNPVEDLEGFQKGIADALKNFDPNAWEGGVVSGGQGFVGTAGTDVLFNKGATVDPAFCLRMGNVPILGVVVEKTNDERGVIFIVLNPDAGPVDPNNGYMKGVVTDVDGILRALDGSSTIPSLMITTTNPYPAGDPWETSNTPFIGTFFGALPVRQAVDVSRWMSGEVSDEDSGPIFLIPINIQGYED